MNASDTAPEPVPAVHAGAGGGPLVGVIMGSRSDWDTMRHAAEALRAFGVAHECRVVSAHRTPEWLARYAREAEGRGLEVIVAGAGGAAHLPGMVAAETLLPVFGVPVQTASLGGLDSLLSIVQMPRGVPVGTLAIGAAGAANAALLAIRVLALRRPELARALAEHRSRRADEVLAEVLPDA
jgi:5-(carboxyamino)imidazole ribonucleotide mutase